MCLTSPETNLFAMISHGDFLVVSMHVYFDENYFHLYTRISGTIDTV